MLQLGDGVPHFYASSTVNPRFCFDTAAGRYIVLCFFGSTQFDSSERFLQGIVDRGEKFDVTNFIFFGVTNDPEDVERIQHQDPGRIYFHDLDFSISKQYGVVRENVDFTQATYSIKPTTFVLDQALRVIAILSITDDTEQCLNVLFKVLDSVPSLKSLSFSPPVLIVPYVFEREFCRELMNYYEKKGGEDSGFMRDVNGKTVGIIDYAHKRRMDCEVTDERLIRAAQERIKRRVVPAIQQSFQFNVTRIERHIVACYDAEQGAHFKAHRDNTTLGTAHRRFAITINLNSEEYEGGEIWFPEFSPRKYKAPSGAAIVFSCSLLHEVPRVTRGKRYAYLPFLYDEAAAAIRERNRGHLGDLSGAGSGNVKPSVCNATPKSSRSTSSVSILDGTCGCGNPEGCSTCLSAKTYPLTDNAEHENNS